jgi:hypothetical protein
MSHFSISAKIFTHDHRFKMLLTLASFSEPSR